ncbi:unnamed protein product [Phytophthora lilii]|uniref:Unnamed protein product n=1 Tax=Phytophthora lilii TaxID=2077276 RepID=A0A9W6TTY2_9STRA|nr:unnamed protein product [Phytophthora lilii]
MPALRENQPQASISSDVIRDLENRELSTNDYDMLLRLDHRDKHPIQDYLVKVVSGTKVSAENAKTFGDPGDTCSMCAQSLRIKSSLHSTACGVLPDLVSAGIKAMGRSNTDLPLSQVGSAVRNQLEHDRVRISSSRHSTPRQPGKRAKPTHTKSVLLPPLNQRYAPPDQTMTESRLSHAEKTRAELMAAEKERLQRQGQLREERRERHKQSYDNPAFYGGFIGTDRSETTQSTIPHSAREEQCRVIHRKLKMQQQRVRQNPLPTNFPDLYIGNKM